MGKRIDKEDFDNLLNFEDQGMLITDKDGQILFYNSSVEKLFRVKQSPALGKNIIEIYPSTCLLDILNTGKDKSMIYEINNIPVMANASCLFDEWGNKLGAVAVFNNVQNIEKASLYNYDGIWILDENAQTVYVNSILTNMMKTKNGEELMDEKIENLFQKVVNNKKPLSICNKFLDFDNALITGVPIIERQSKISRVVFYIRDITEYPHVLPQTNINTTRLDKEKKAKGSSNEIIYASPEMSDIFEKIYRVNNVDSTVLLTGDTGVGKNMFAKFIHESSKRNSKPLVEINCSLIPDTLLESELFGYKDGTFTGAKKRGKRGLFEYAQGGTVFIDEIGGVNLEAQKRLLKILDEKKIVAVGSYQPVNLDIRIIAASNSSLEKLVDEGHFRKDLYYRLNVLPIHIPPLKDRKEDISTLLSHFLNKANSLYGKDVLIADEVMNVLEYYSWPGNVRELKNLAEQMVISCNSKEIAIDNLPERILKEVTRKSSEVAEQMCITLTEGVDSIMVMDLVPLNVALEKVEKQLIQKALKKYKTTRAAAKALKINYSTVSRKAKKYHLSCGSNGDEVQGKSPNKDYLH